MTVARQHQINLTDTPYYHCIGRCVRRAFLCGEDPVTGQNYEHRRQWIVDKLAELTAIFAMDVCAYAVMSNHYHVVLHVNIERVSGWSNHEVIEHWLKLFKAPVLIQRYWSGESQSSAEQQKATEIIADWRERLSDLSWFMRCLNESIARQANAEDGCKGRFWEGRFKSQALLDEAAVLTCMAYVDLNPIRAGLAQTPEDSDYTAIQARIKAYHAEMDAQDDSSTGTQNTDATPPLPSPALWPFSGDEHTDQPEGIAFHLTDYFTLVDWTGRAIRDDKRAAIPEPLPTILHRLGLDEHHWIDNVEHFGRRFHRAIGPVERLRQLGQALGRCWLHGVMSCQGLYQKGQPA